MTRKKVSDDLSEADAAANLREDEEIVLSDVRTIRKNKRRPPEPIKEEEPDDDDFTDAELVDDNPFPAGTVGYRAFGDNSDTSAITECNILVVRKPDGAGDNFLKPCKSRMSESPIRNVELSATESEIEEIVRLNCGGGHYYLQTQFGNRNGRGWSVSLSDPSDAIAKAKAEQDAAKSPPPTPAEPPRDLLDTMLENLTKMKMLRDALFGDERERLEREIEQMKHEIENRPEPAPAMQLPENLQILEKALATNNPTLQEKLLDYAFPPTESSHWIPDTLKLFFEHKEEIGGILGGLLSSFMPPQPTPQGIEAILRTQPPTGVPAMPVVQPSQFRPRQIARTDDDENSDAETGDAEARTLVRTSSDETEPTEPESEEPENGDSKLDGN